MYYVLCNHFKRFRSDKNFSLRLHVADKLIRNFFEFK